jgi:hypothetical protein
LPQPVLDVAVRRDEHPVYALLLEEVEIARLSLGVFRRVAEDHREPELRGLVFGAASDVGEERVSHVEHDEADGRAATRPQLARGVVAHVAEFGDRGPHLRRRIGRDARRAVEHVRHGAHRHPGENGDVADAARARGGHAAILTVETIH